MPPSCAEGRHEPAIVVAQDHYVWVRLVEEVAELEGSSPSIPLAPPFVINKKGAPPGAWGGDFLQIIRPEQPLAPVREAHVHHHVLLSPVTTNRRAD